MLYIGVALITSLLLISLPSCGYIAITWRAKLACSSISLSYRCIDFISVAGFCVSAFRSSIRVSFWLHLVWHPRAYTVYLPSLPNRLTYFAVFHFPRRVAWSFYTCRRQISCVEGSLLSLHQPQVFAVACELLKGFELISMISCCFHFLKRILNVFFLGFSLSLVSIVGFFFLTLLG